MALILWLQAGANAWLDYVFTAFTMLGTAEFYLVAIPMIYWTISAEAGAALAVLFPFSMWVNAGLKELFHLPRPPLEAVRFIHPETGYGLPSGHAQGAVTFWGYLALRFRRRWLVWAGAALVLLISLSRLYLGVHYPLDILAGWGVGFVMLLAAWLLAWRRPAFGLWVAAVGALLLFLLLPALPDAGQITGSAAGATLGYAWQQRRVGWQPSGPWPGRVLPALAGLLVLQGLRQGLKLALGLAPAADFVRYLLIGFVAFGLLPWLFRKTQRPADLQTSGGTTRRAGEGPSNS